VNASWMDTFVRQFHSVDINLFVNTKEGLVTPILRDVGGRGLKAIADEVYIHYIFIYLRIYIYVYIYIYSYTLYFTHHHMSTICGVTHMQCMLSLTPLFKQDVTSMTQCGACMQQAHTMYSTYTASTLIARSHCFIALELLVVIDSSLFRGIQTG
jgi:hypothetical protein